MNIFISIIFFLIIPNTAYAYLDPITISYAVTFIIGVIAFILSKIKKFLFIFEL